MDKVHSTESLSRHPDIDGYVSLGDTDSKTDVEELNGRASVFRPWRLDSVHVRAFHASWTSFCIITFATFAPAALTVPIRDTLDLTEGDIALGGALTIAGTALCRVLLGSLCDAYGPKIVDVSILLMTSLPLFCVTVVNQPIGHTICRMLIGLSMAGQTVSLYWCSKMFDDEIVGSVTATTLGLAETGFGLSQLLMPLIFGWLSSIFESFVAWRVALLIPGVLQLLVTIYIITATERHREKTSSNRQRQGVLSKKEWKAAAGNYRTWIFTILNGIVLGLGLAIYNIITTYYFDTFDISFALAGFLGSLAGLVNIIWMPAGGLLSDFVSRWNGMPGRMWFTWISMIGLGSSLIFLAASNDNLTHSIVAMQLVLAFIAGFAAALFSMIPYVSHRALGLVEGIVGSGANVIGAIIQELLFNKSRMDTHEGFFWGGIITLCSSLLMMTVYYPMWGGMIWKPIPGVNEVTYYLSEYTQEEIQMGMAEKSRHFAQKAAADRSSRV